MSNSKRLLAEMNVEMSEKEALEEAKVKRRRLSNTLSTAKGSSEMGIIEEIYCENFMCHHKMRVQLVRTLYIHYYYSIMVSSTVH